MVRYLHPVAHHPARIRKVDTLFGAKLDFEDTKFPVKIRAIFTNLEKRIAQTLGSSVMKVIMLDSKIMRGE